MFTSSWSRAIVVPGALLAAFVLANAQAGTDKNADLRDTLARTRVQLANADADRANIAGQLATISEGYRRDHASLAQALAAIAAANTKLALNNHGDGAASVQQSADNAAAAQSASVAATGIATKAASDAKEAARVAKAQAQQLASGNSSLVIVQSFGFGIVIVGFIYKGFEHHWEVQDRCRREARQEKQRLEALGVATMHGAQLTQIHTLVNSNLTASMQAELDSLRRLLIAVREASEAKRALGFPQTNDATSELADIQSKVTELSATVAARQKQTQDAEARLQLDIKKDKEAK
jgi:hypothetical protein